jgi:hypothetical protein
MKRRTIFKLLLLLFVGAIINVVVAWGCVYADSRILGPDADERRSSGILVWPRGAPDSWPAPTQFTQLSGFGLLEEWAYCIKSPFEPSDSSHSEIQEEWSLRRVEAGWPWRSMCIVDAYFAPREGPWETNSSFMRGLQAPSIHGRVEQLPVAPIWPGFAWNTLLISMILWLFFAAPFSLRRRFRIKRGQCAACGYDLRSNALQSEKCPECGAVAAEVQ